MGWFAVTLGSVCLGFHVEGAPALAQWTQRGTGLIIVVAGVWAVLRGRRHLTQVLTDLRLLFAYERIVLFLRAFSDDKGFSRVNAQRPLLLLLGSVVTPADVRTEEDQVARAVAPFGRMVALGNPRDKLPVPGADRSYASDETWRHQVLAALSRANLVVLAAGAGRGLAWEVDQVVHRDPRCLLLVVSRDRHQYARFREYFAHRFPRGLPDYPVRMWQRILRGRYVRAVIWFDGDWTPHLEMLDGRFPLIGAARRTQRALRRVLRPVYQRAGVPARVKPTMARPWAVKLSIALTLMFWLSPVIWLSLVAINITSESNSPDQIAEPSTTVDSGTSSLVDPCSFIPDTTGCYIGCEAGECKIFAGEEQVSSCSFVTANNVTTCSFTIGNESVVCVDPPLLDNCAATSVDSTASPPTGSGNPTPVDGFVGFVGIWLLLIAGLLGPWMYRVWRGGPIAITMARVQSLSFPVLLLALAVSLFFSPAALFSFAFSIGISGFVLGPWLVFFGLALLVLGMLGMFATTFLLIRRDVREWIDSRL
ncbi:hypothetical protein [Actinophytocola algeriensis]|uniref:Uncharacterized protein n=1 Tax=Actinophytocola algeriensis TaxID=1768010 RepID=A0A7W7Q3L6_9PSEU|nr:hypothetical protein [Actinophytocola algeriensis]MBB4906263.1 hypothetical protein [Actinophytocola algeriensis]MBE1472052.1 hypothetical protein [Actinophytocola algeriensis]